MKGTRKKYDAKFKAKVALEAIKERETLNELAVKYEVSPAMISRWKKEFIENSAPAFEAPQVDDAAIEKEKDRYLRVIGDLQMQLDLPSVSIGVARHSKASFASALTSSIGCKAGIQKIGDRDARRGLVSPEHDLSLNKQCAILGLNRTSIYDTPKGESKECALPLFVAFPVG